MDLTRISKKLSYLLRHCTDPLYIELIGAWAPVDTMITVLQKSYPGFDREKLDMIVASDEKGRYSYNADGTKIRANQGHSIPGVVIEMDSPDPPDLLYHGTATRFLDSILREGILPKGRGFVHISPDFDTAVRVGRRHGKPVVLVIDAKRFVDDGNELYISSNGVWQSRCVPPQYFTVEYPHKYP